LVVIPCWWGGDLKRYKILNTLRGREGEKEREERERARRERERGRDYIIIFFSLAASIDFQRPDLFLPSTSKNDPISFNPPKKFFQSKSICKYDVCV
jgi:hypothetical protein